MSSYPETSARPASANPVRRPGTLTTTMVFAILTAVAAIGNGIVILTGGKQLILDAVAGDAGLPAGIFTEEDYASFSDSAAGTLDDAASTFATRAYILLAMGVLLLVCGVLMNKAATWARVVVTIAAPLAMVFSVVVVADTSTPIMAGLALGTILFGLITLIMVWLPPNNRYAKSFR